MAATAMDYETSNGDRYDDEAPRYERDDRSASPRPMRDDVDDGGRDDVDDGGRRSASPDGHANSSKDRPEPKDDDDDGAVNPGSNLFVTGIHPRLSEDEVAKMFEKYGDVEKCEIMRDPHSKESRGFGFVKMVTSEQAEAAREGLQGEQIEGRTLSIEKARRAKPRTPTPGKYFGPPKRDPRGGRFDDRRRGGGGYGAGYGRDDSYRYRGGYSRDYERGDDRGGRYSRDDRYDDRERSYRDDRGRDDRGRYDRYNRERDYDRGYNRRDDGGYGGRDRPSRGGYDRDRYDRAAERDIIRSRESGTGGSSYGEPAPRSEARDSYAAGSGHH